MAARYYGICPGCQQGRALTTWMSPAGLVYSFRSHSRVKPWDDTIPPWSSAQRSRPTETCPGSHEVVESSERYGSKLEAERAQYRRVTAFIASGARVTR